MTDAAAPVGVGAPVPGVGPAHRLSPTARAAGTAGQHVWERTRIAWHATFAALLLVVVLDALTGGELAAGRRPAVLVLVAAIAAWYGTLGLRAFGNDRVAALYTVGIIPLSVGTFALHPSAGLLFFVVFSQFWAVLPVGRAIAAVVVEALGIGVVSATVLSLSVAAVAAQTAAAVGFSLLLGLFISRIIDQSRDRAAVIGELERTRTELAAVSREAGVLAERERLAREIHDTLAQGFTSMLMLVELAESDVDTHPEAARKRLGEAQETARQNLAEARSLVAALSPVDLQAASLPQAVGRLVDRFGREGGLPATYAVGGEPRPLPANHEIVLLRAAQEALANVRKHAGRCRVTVELGYRPDGTELVVTDDGAGFAPEESPAGYGLAGMRRRVQEVGGTLDVDSRAAGGTTLRVRIP